MPRVLFVTANTLRTRELALLDTMAALPRVPVRSRGDGSYEPILAVPGDGSLAAAAEERGVDTYIVPGRPAPASARIGDWLAFLLDLPARRRAYATLLAEQGISLVHATSPRAGIAAALAARSLGIPVIWTLRHLQMHGPIGALWRSLVKRLPDQLIATSEGAATALLADPSRIPVIPEGLDAPAFEQRAIKGHGTIWRQYGIPLRRPLIGFVGLPMPDEGQIPFVGAAARIAAARRDSRFLVINREAPESRIARDYQATVESLAEGMGLDEYIIFGGPHEEVGHLLVDFDILVHCPTHPDPHQRTLLEAMALGIPVVATAVGATPELVADGETGLLVPPDDHGALAAAVLALLAPSANQRRYAIAAQAKARVQAEFDLQTVLRRTTRLYDTLTRRQTASEPRALPGEQPHP